MIFSNGWVLLGMWFLFGAIGMSILPIDAYFHPVCPSCGRNCRVNRRLGGKFAWCDVHGPFDPKQPWPPASDPNRAIADPASHRG